MYTYLVYNTLYQNNLIFAVLARIVFGQFILVMKLWIVNVRRKREMANLSQGENGKQIWLVWQSVGEIVLGCTLTGEAYGCTHSLWSNMSALIRDGIYWHYNYQEDVGVIRRKAVMIHWPHGMIRILIHCSWYSARISIQFCFRFLQSIIIISNIK